MNLQPSTPCRHDRRFTEGSFPDRGFSYGRFADWGLADRGFTHRGNLRRRLGTREVGRYSHASHRKRDTCRD
jgi:hypothetical protein